MVKRCITHFYSKSQSGAMPTFLFPLYIYPSNGGAPWAPLLDAVRSNPTAKTLVVVNPSNGPGERSSNDYVAGIGALDAAAVPMAGYVYTKYGSRAAQDVEQDLVTWTKLYPQVKQVFVDNMSNEPGLEQYYAGLTQYAKSLGFQRIIGNPGVAVPRSYFGTVDVIIIYENTGYPSSAAALDPQGWYSMHPGSFGMIVHGVDSLDVPLLESASKIVDYVCVTQTYHAFPPYLGDLISTIVRL